MPHALPRGTLGPGRAIARGAIDYPPALEALARPPERMFVAGALPPLERAVAVVGTRRATSDGRAVARALGRELAAAGCVVVSGAAEGIDGEAHAGALERARVGVTACPAGATLAVLATPLSAPYPAANVPLLAAIVASGGGVLTEAPAGAVTFRGSFLERNRLVAALARAVVVVEAPVRSGTLSTAAHARRLGRAVFCVPWSPLEPQRAGGVALLSTTDARACRDARDVLRALGWPAPALAAAQKRRDRTRYPLPPEHADDRSEEAGAAARVLRAVALGAAHADAVVAGTGLGAADVAAALFDLVLDGALVEAAGRYRLAR